MPAAVFSGVRAPGGGPRRGDPRFRCLARRGNPGKPFARVLRRAPRRPGYPPPDPDAGRAEALALLDTFVARYRAAIPPPSESVFQAEARDLREEALAFLTFLREFPTVPAFLEAGFGMGDGEDALSPDPVEIPAGDGKTIRLRGRIDRIDPGPGDGMFRVWDYKTGSPSSYLPPVELAGGTRLQHGLYAAAAEILLSRHLGRAVEVVESGYLFPTRRAGEVVPHPRPGWRKALEALPALLDAMAAGLFVATGRDCGWCNFERVCGGGAAAAWNRLREADDEAVRRYREVEDHV